MTSITPNSKKRGYLLPKGCKNLIDVLNGKPAEIALSAKASSVQTFFFKMNKKIRAVKVSVIDATRREIGTMSLAQALNLAEEKNLDLVEIGPDLHPPLCVVIDWSKFMQGPVKEI